VLTQYLGQEESSRIMLSINENEGDATEQLIEKALDSQRKEAMQSMVSQLQSENAEVTKAKRVLLFLRDSAQEEVPALGNKLDAELKDQITQNRDVLKNAIGYISKNRQAIDEVTLSKLNDSLNLKATLT